MIIRYIKYYWYRLKYIAKWLWFIKDQHNFDYIYLINIIKFKLESMLEFFQSNGYRETTIVQQRIKTILRLIDIVYIKESYIEEHNKFITELFGEYIFNLDDSGTITKFYERDYTDDQILLIEEYMFEDYLVAVEKTNKAHRILWALFEHNIKNFWD